MQWSADWTAVSVQTEPGPWAVMISVYQCSEGRGVRGDNLLAAEMIVEMLSRHNTPQLRGRG